VQISEGSSLTDRSQTSELLAVAFNTGTSSLVEYASVFSTTDLGSFDTLMNNIGTDTVVNLYFISNDSVPKTIKIIKTLITP
jgi:hypothetical protein